MRTASSTLSARRLSCTAISLDVVETEMLWRLASDAEDAGDFQRARRLAEQGAELGDPSC